LCPLGTLKKNKKFIGKNNAQETLPTSPVSDGIFHGYGTGFEVSTSSEIIGFKE